MPAAQMDAKLMEIVEDTAATALPNITQEGITVHGAQKYAQVGVDAMGKLIDSIVVGASAECMLSECQLLIRLLVCVCSDSFSIKKSRALLLSSIGPQLSPVILGSCF